MRYYALACDYDGTLATHGRVDRDTLAAMERLLATGRKLILVTGRELPDLQNTFSELHFFTWVVAENGALLYDPASRAEKVLVEPPPSVFAKTLRGRGVPVSTGRVIVATWEPHEKTVLEVIHELGLELQVIFNKGAVMVLPAGVTKASGLKAALREMSLSPHEVVAVGDAENDHALLHLAECSVAVANALPAIQERVDWVTPSAHGRGVAELMDRLVADDLASLEPRLLRHHLLLGHTPDGTEVRIPPYGLNVLIAGPSGSGKSTAAASLLERLAENHYQFCIVDPEGDYEQLEGAVSLGTPQRGPTATEVLQLLAPPREHAVVNLVGLAIPDRPPFFAKLLSQLQELRSRTSRPHWLIVDEAHHLLPASWEPGPLVLMEALNRMVFITVHPGMVSPAVLRSVGALIAVGPSPHETIAEFCQAIAAPAPALPPARAGEGGVVFWQRRDGGRCQRVRLLPGPSERRRHVRKYAEGELPPERSFFFRGPDEKLNLRAQNLLLFVQIAEGVDDATWDHHLRQGDYSRWFREHIKDNTLADEAAAVERRADVNPAQTRAMIRAIIERYYTSPAGPPLPMPGTDSKPKLQGPPPG